MYRQIDIDRNRIFIFKAKKAKKIVAEIRCLNLAVEDGRKRSSGISSPCNARLSRPTCGTAAYRSEAGSPAGDGMNSPYSSRVCPAARPNSPHGSPA